MGCGAVPQGLEQGLEQGLVYQVSTIDALLQGLYDGFVTVGELKAYGDFGIGTFHGLEGEMVFLGGEMYQVRDDGSVHEVPHDTTVPFATVLFFQPQKKLTLGQVDSFLELEEKLDTLRDSNNYVYAFKLEGDFSYVKTRSVPRQEQPYPPLVEIAALQPTFEFEDVQGTLVGFWCPGYLQGINVPGYHLHFITGDRQGGGHLLECRLLQGEATVSSSQVFKMVLPDSEDFRHLDLAGDLQEELEKVER